MLQFLLQAVYARYFIMLRIFFKLLIVDLNIIKFYLKKNQRVIKGIKYNN